MPLSLRAACTSGLGVRCSEVPLTGSGSEMVDGCGDGVSWRKCRVAVELVRSLSWFAVALGADVSGIAGGATSNTCEGKGANEVCDVPLSTVASKNGLSGYALPFPFADDDMRSVACSS